MNADEFRSEPETHYPAIINIHLCASVAKAFSLESLLSLLLFTCRLALFSGGSGCLAVSGGAFFLWGGWVVLVGGTPASGARAPPPRGGRAPPPPPPQKKKKKKKNQPPPET